MEVLGLHGVYPRSHDASACLVEDGTIAALAEEERFTRSKKALDQKPTNAATFCLETAQQDVNALDAIAIGWQGPDIEASSALPPQYARDLNREVPVVKVEHHEAHAAGVFYTSPFDEAAVLVIDGQGEHESTTIWQGSQKGLEKVESYPVDQSLGYLYGAVTSFCGLGTFGAGKLMGLAPYGDAKYVDQLAAIYAGIKLPPQTGFDSQDAYFAQFIEGLLKQGFPRATYTYPYSQHSQTARRVPELLQVHRDLAASAQVFLEQEVLKLAEQTKRLTGADNLCLSGGVAMNCVTNSLIQNSGLFNEVFMQPGCEDSGISLGAALAVTKQKAPLHTVYTGPAFDSDHIGKLLEERGVRATRHEDIATAVAELLADNQIVGWVQGGLEYGPRALGARSILANPADRAMRDKVNTVKHREDWRPFGPSVLAEAAEDLFETPHESRFMLRSFQVRSEWAARMGAIVHVDGSTRPQTVEPGDHQRYYNLIKAFAGLTGIPGVLNTSFNDAHEPIVSSPDDALRTFFSTGLGALALGDYLIVK